MKYNFESYINYLLTSIIADVEVYYHWWMFLVFPAVFYTLFLVLKYLMLTLPFWIVLTPINKIIFLLKK